MNNKEDFTHENYLFDGYDPPEPQPQEKMTVSDLPQDEEDRLRQLLCLIFDLQPLELLLLRAIMKGKGLQEFADEMTEFLTKQTAQMQKNQEGRFTRHFAFKIRQHILDDHPELKLALITVG